MSDCVCVACGTQCEICLQPYPSACTCPSDADAEVCDTCGVEFSAFGINCECHLEDNQ